MSPRSAIVVIDLLKGFFKSNPTLPDPLDAKRLFATVRRVIDGGRERGAPGARADHRDAGLVGHGCQAFGYRSRRSATSPPISSMIRSVTRRSVVGSSR